MEILDTTDAVIEALGGVEAVARLTGRSTSWVYKCKLIAEGQFPGNRDLYFTITAALANIGLRASLKVWKLVPPEACSSDPDEIPDGS